MKSFKKSVHKLQAASSMTSSLSDFLLLPFVVFFCQLVVVRAKLIITSQNYLSSSPSSSTHQKKTKKTLWLVIVVCGASFCPVSSCFSALILKY
jgi:hypothetical protein